MKPFITLLFAHLLLMASCNAPSKNSYTDSDVDSFAQMAVEPQNQLVDVRTPEEYAEGHLKNAVLINIKDDDFDKKAERLLKKDRKVLVYCRSGRRSAEAAQRLADKGYKVVNLEGGYLKWTESGCAVEDNR